VAAGEGGGGRVAECLEGHAAALRSGGYWNCLTAARELSALLLAEGREPFIARLRKTEPRDGYVFHGPLTPRVRGLKAAWTTHYVCCCDGKAYDPVAGAPVPLDVYTSEVFGEQIPPEVFVPCERLPAYLAGEWKP
jgi:hypothetical protein